MITSLEIENAQQRMKTDHRDDSLIVEIWENDNTYISDGLIDKKFEFEITKENSIKLAKTILAAYNVSF
jgi:transcriptional regulator